ncbi:MAG: preprotein translocase subunit YajC [Epsilonproteobacteria bacterium]|nr:preprotein translocase subunit YajC [Campylobacterota bacterium]
MNGAEQGSTLMSFLPLIALFAIFYFLIIRPQQKQQQKHKDMINALTKGDKIITNGGLYAEVVKVEENFIKIKLNEDTIVKIDKAFVAKKVDLVNNEAV